MGTSHKRIVLKNIFPLLNQLPFHMVPFCYLHSVWPDWAIFCTLGNFFKPLATIILPKSLTFLGNFCKGIKIYHFSSEIIVGQLLQTFGDFYLVTLPTLNEIITFSSSNDKRCTSSYTDRIVSWPIFASFTDKKLQNSQLYLSTFATK